jgi:hypothetical protein
MDGLIKRLRIKIGFFFKNRPWLSLKSRKQSQLALPVRDYGDTIYTASTSLKPLDAVYQSALRFIMGDKFSTLHCILYQNVG